MAKGFTDSNGKFRPTGNSTGNSSKQKTIEPKGVLLDRRRLTLVPEGTIADLSDVRLEGNEIIEKLVQIVRDSHPDLQDYIIHNEGIYNEYDGIQKTFFYSKDNVEKLLEWREDPSPDTWKWKIPLFLENPNNQADLFIESQDTFFTQDAFKGKVTITIMSPRDYLRLSCPICLEDFDESVISGRDGFADLDFDMRGKEDTQATINEIDSELRKGNPVNTVRLEITDNKVVTHEGRHRAFGAMKAGIEQIPVYVYSLDNEPMEDDFRERITNDPTNELIPDNPRRVFPDNPKRV